MSMHPMTPTMPIPPLPEIAPGDLDAARRFLLGDAVAPAPPCPSRRPRAAAIAMPTASFGIARARRRPGRAQGAA